MLNSYLYNNKLFGLNNMARDDFSAPTKRLIAARAAHLCGFEGCGAQTAGPAVDKNNSVNLGEAAHISAASPGGPRYDSSLTSEERTSAENGIWLCGTHAKLIDRDTDRFPLETLREWKINAENAAMNLLGVPNRSVKQENLIEEIEDAIQFRATDVPGRTPTENQLRKLLWG